MRLRRQRREAWVVAPMGKVTDAVKRGGAIIGIGASIGAGQPGIPHALDQLLHGIKDSSGEVAKELQKKAAEAASQDREQRRAEGKNTKKKK